MLIFFGVVFHLVVCFERVLSFFFVCFECVLSFCIEFRMWYIVMKFCICMLVVDVGFVIICTIIIMWGFWFLVCYAGTQLAIQLQQECIQVVYSNREARKRPAESNGTPAMDLEIEDIRKRRYTDKRGKEQNTRP